MIRGHVYWVDLEDAAPPELGKTRPAIVLSNSEQNAVLSTVIIVPISTRPPHLWPLRLELPPLPRLKKSFAIVPGLRQVSKSRLLASGGSISDDFLAALTDAVAAYLGD